MSAAKPQWLRKAKFVTGALGVVVMSAVVPMLIFIYQRNHSSRPLFLIPLFVINIGLGMRLMWRNGHEQIA